MTAFLEKVARGICYTNCITEHPGDIERAECQAANGWEMWLPEARAAVEAMREPDSAMITAGACVIMDRRHEYVSAIEISPPVYQAMIGAALGEI